MTLKNIPLFEQVIPSKIFEVMGCARPVLLAARGEAAEIVRAAGAGWVVPPEDVDAMYCAIREARTDLERARARGLAGHRYVSANFDRDELAGSYLAHLRDACEDAG